MASVSTSAQLRTAIQNASSSDPTINVATGSYSSITTLAKLVCYPPEPAVPYSAYNIIGTTPRTSTIINDTRIYQKNIDGPYAPTSVKDLTLQYNSTSNNTAILNATTGTYTLDNLLITGQHSGWAGNGGVYMALTTSDGTNPISANLTLANSTVSVTNQTGNAAFLQSWNNSGMVTLTSNQFNESGLNAGSFHFATMYPGGDTSAGVKGMYKASNNTFTGSGTVKTRGNRLETVEAMIYGNTFSNGAYLDLYGNLLSVTIDNNGGLGAGNIFNTIYGGCGLKFNRTSSSGATLVTLDPDTGGTILVAENTFTGYGLAVVNNNSTSQLVTLVGANNMIKTGNLSTQTFGRLVAGGSVNNTINVSGATNDWINSNSGNDTILSGAGNDYVIGGLGNDSISSGIGNDTILYYETTEGQDIITDFVSGSDCLAFRGNNSGGSTFFNFTPGTSLTAGTNFITSGPPPTSGPTFIYTGGVLSYDADGNGGGAAVNIATLTGSPTLLVSDIKFF
jgi:hypothetical protein